MANIAVISCVKTKRKGKMPAKLLYNLPNKMNAQQKRQWAYRVATQLKTKIKPNDTLHFYCGQNYRKELIKLLPNIYNSIKNTYENIFCW